MLHSLLQMQTVYRHIKPSVFLTGLALLAMLALVALFSATGAKQAKTEHSDRGESAAALHAPLLCI